MAGGEPLRDDGSVEHRPHGNMDETLVARSSTVLRCVMKILRLIETHISKSRFDWYEYITANDGTSWSAPQGAVHPGRASLFAAQFQGLRR
jgi:hypothetical protein